MALRLIIEDDEGTTTVVPLGADAITIGRQQGNTIQLTEKNVSRRHARLFPEPDDESWCIEDLGSYNGVKVNGAAVEARIELSEGDVVQIGDYHLTLTENADKTAVAPAPTAAANDPQPEEPMLASSSNDLPRLSTEDLAALQSGPVPIQQPMAMESGAVPAVAAPAAGFEEERKSSAGLLIGAGALVVGALVVAFAWMAGSGNDGPNTNTVAAAERPKIAADPKAMAQVDPNAGLEPGVVEAEPDTPPPNPEGDEPAAGAESGEPVPEDVPPVEPEPEPTSVVEPLDPPPTEVEPTPAPSKPPKNRNRPRNRPKNETSNKKPPPPSPEKPSVDAAALLSEAKKLSLNNYSKCYDVAKQAYDAGRSSDAAYTMTACACKMGDEGKAKRAASKLRGAKRDKVAKLCTAKGIEL